MRKPEMLCLLAAAVLLPAAAIAGELPPQLGRYMPLYPGLYFTGAAVRDYRDSAFDQAGTEHASASPSAGGATAFPEHAFLGSFLWHFPVLESYGLPFVSTRTHFARVDFSLTDTTTQGRLANFAADSSDDNSTEADKLEKEGRGLGDLTLEFGSYLYGSPAPQWRERTSTPLAVLASASVNLPFGVYNRDAPISAGSNTLWFQGRVAAHWQPWPGTFVDAGYAYRSYNLNYDAAFGREMPTDQGNDQLGDLSLAQRFAPDWYFGVFATRRVGAPNMYRSPRFAPNPPAPSPTTSMAPALGDYYDQGTLLTTVGVSLNWFVTQRWLAGLHLTVPASGRSGEFDLPYEEHSPAGCKNGATNCTTTPAGSVHVDGLGPARVYSSDRVTFTLTHNFGLGDTFTCTGCKQ